MASGWGRERVGMERERFPPCPGKTPYSSREKAKRTAVSCMNQRKKRLRVYFCRDCRAWHLTSERKWE